MTKSIRTDEKFEDSKDSLIQKRLEESPLKFLIRTFRGNDPAFTNNLDDGRIIPRQLHRISKMDE